jgi:hypothetical protein
VNKFLLLSLSLLLSVSPSINATNQGSRVVLSKKFTRHALELGFPSKKLDNHSLDLIAQHYCKNHTKTYVAIVWPRGESQINLIKSMMTAANCELFYQKCFYLENDGPKFLDHMAHPEKPIHNIIKNAQNYIPAGMVGPYKFYTVLFKTEMPLSEIIFMKQNIRAAVGASYFSLHIDDFNKESQHLCEIVFNDAILDSICHKPF